MDLRVEDRRQERHVRPQSRDLALDEVGGAHREDAVLAADGDQVDEGVALGHLAHFARRRRRHGDEMAGHCVLLDRPHRVETREHLDGVPVELHVLAAFHLHDLLLGDAGRAQHVSVGLRADHHRAGLLRDDGDVGEMVPVAMADEDVVCLADVLIDQALVGRDRRVRVELAAEESAVETAEPGIDEDGLPAEGDLPAVRAEPLEPHPASARSTALGRGLGSLREPGEHQTCSGGGRSRQSSADDLPAEETGCFRFDEAHVSSLGRARNHIIQQ